ncbi:hypothetical protein MKW92_007504, partial [Papaver armeniacum]
FSLHSFTCRDVNNSINSSRLMFPHNYGFNGEGGAGGKRKLKGFIPLKASFWENIRSGFSKNNTTQVVEPPPSETELDEEEPFEQEVFLVDKIQPDGTIEQIMFSSGGSVDVYELQALFYKVGWPKRPPSKVAAALKNIYMVATLHSIKKFPDA